MRIDLERGTITTMNRANRPAPWQFAPCPPEVCHAVRRAQLLARMRRIVENEGFAD
ncbi:MAG: hypothetical protein HC876_19970 [Chloroflexaceae bacterium]|nr:hypothetical protein [Chloroflexaceae bacterium]